MARRSPLNARYQKYQEPAGKTRKSAAAAKPSRKGASESSSSSTSKSTKTTTGRGGSRLDPQTPEFKALRRQWWILLGVGLVLVTASWGVRYIDKPGGFLASGRIVAGSFNMTYGSLLTSLTLGLAYACIFYALYLDFAKMRPMRQAGSTGSKPAKSAEKPTKAENKESSTD